jgi:hypothetical protein
VEPAARELITENAIINENWMYAVSASEDSSISCLGEHFFDDDIAREGAASIEPDIFAKIFAEWKLRLQQSNNQG